MRVLAVTAVFACLGGMVSAQDWTYTVQGEWSGARACSADATACLLLGCVTQAPLVWEMDFGTDVPGDVLLHDSLVAEVSVDGRVVAALPLDYDPAPDTWLAAASGESTDRMIAALQAGNRSSIAISAGPVLATVAIGLDGSRNAIDAALLACRARAPETVQAPLPAPVKPAPEPAPVAVSEPAPEPAAAAFPEPFPNAVAGGASANPAADALAGIARDCGGVGNVTVGPGFVALRDLNGDGINDAILDHGAIACADIAVPYCGTAGCWGEIWLGGADGLFTQVFGGHAQAITPAGPGLIDFAFHGGACGLAGAEACQARMRIAGGALQRAD